MNWRPVYKQGSLPYNEGDRFLARINECFCGTEEINIKKCSKNRPCIRDFLTVNEFNFFYIKENGRHTKNVSYSKQGIVSRYKFWKIIQPERSKREDIFVCQCKDVCILKSINDDSLNDYSKLSCCHCKQIMMRCSEHCRNAVRGQ